MSPIVEDLVVQSPAPVDRRGEMRREVARSGRPRFNQGRCALRCTIVDLSVHGARLRFGDICALPTEFELEIAGETRVRRARVRWRTLTEMGIVLE